MLYPKDISVVSPVVKELIPTYNAAGALEKIKFDSDTYVSQIAYNAKGQRLLIAYGNGIMTRYIYDALTFRLLRQRTESFTETSWVYTSAGNIKKDTAYQYDLIGNIVNTNDDTAHCGIANANTLDRDFDYDAIYRLISANGRENAPIASQPWDNSYRSDDNSFTTGYTQNYEYDKLGNVTKLQHLGASNFTRNFSYTSTSNKLDSIIVGLSSYAFSYDLCGNQLTETSSRKWEWDHGDRARCFYVEATGSITQYTQYLYDAGGNRVKKLTWKTGGIYDSIAYLDGVFEYRTDGTDVQTLFHIMDNSSRIALKRVGDTFGDPTPDVVYNIEDHLGSSLILVDSGGSDVKAEEYFPFGETSFGSYAQKRYKYCGKEWDSESGLYYYGARYYTAWTCRFISVDPKAKEYVSMCAYVYAGNNPVILTDIRGEGPGPSEKRLILYSVKNHDKTNTESFKNASWKLRNEYNNNPGIYGSAKASATDVSNGSEIVKYINQQESDSIKSVDIFSHGSRQGIWFANTEGLQDNSMRGNLYRSKNDQYKENATTNFKSKNVENIEYSKFTKDARIEIHGCETGGSAVEKGDDNLGKTMSSLLYGAGKTDGVVIANYGQSGPDSSGDYRQEGNVRIVYWNGEELFRTNKGGNISDTEIKQAIEKKTQGTNANKTQEAAPKSANTYQATPTNSSTNTGN